MDILKHFETSIVTRSSYAAFLQPRNDTEHLCNFDNSVRSQFVKSSAVLSRCHGSKGVLNNLTAKSSSPPKRMCTDYVYRRVTPMRPSTMLSGSLDDDYVGNKITNARTLSMTLKSILRTRLVTLSEKRWNNLLRKSFIAIYRKIISELFKFNSYQSPGIISEKKTSQIDEKPTKTEGTSAQLIRMPKKDGHLINGTSEILPPKVEELIKLSYVDVIEHRLSHFDVRDPLVQQCSNIFDMKKAIKSNIFNDSKMFQTAPTNIVDLECLPDDRNEYLHRSGPPMTTGTLDRCGSDSKTVVLSSVSHRSTNGSSLMGQDTRASDNDDGILDMDYYPVHDTRDSGKLRTRRRRSNTADQSIICTDLPKERDTAIYNRIEGDQSGMLESITRCSRSHSREDSCQLRSFSFTDGRINAKYITHLENMKHYLNTSKIKSNHHLLEDAISGDVNIKTKNVRQKAVAYILKAASNAKLNDHGRILKISANIDRFIDMQNVLSNDNYRCKECTTSFKLGTELRQHARGHSFRQKSCAI